MNRSVICLASLLAAGLLSARGQDQGDLMQVTKEILAFQDDQRAQTERTLRQLYVLKLREWETKAAQVGDYSRAKALKKEIERTRQALGEHRHDPLTLVLDPTEARRHGPLTIIDRQRPAVTGWDDHASLAEWKLPAIPHGGYAVTLRHRGNDTPVQVRLEASHYHLVMTLPAAPDGWKVTSLGNLRITADAPKVSLRTVSPLAANGLVVADLKLVSHAP